MMNYLDVSPIIRSFLLTLPSETSRF